MPTIAGARRGFRGSLKKGARKGMTAAALIIQAAANVKDVAEQNLCLC